MPDTAEEQSDTSRCIKVLQEAQTDNEQFAALLLRDPALKLRADLENSYGSSWIMTENKGERSRFLALIVNLACIEVRMALEEPEPLTSRLITACYSLVEIGIQACTKEEKYPKLQLMGVMRESCAAIIYYLQQCMEKHAQIDTITVV